MSLIKKKKSLVKRWKDLTSGEKAYWKLIAQGQSKYTSEWEIPIEYREYASKNN